MIVTAFKLVTWAELNRYYYISILLFLWTAPWLLFNVHHNTNAPQDLQQFFKIQPLLGALTQ